MSVNTNSLLTAIFMLAGCQSLDHNLSTKGLTAGETFDLKTKCSALGDTLLRLHPAKPPSAVDQTTRYSGAENRCYVLLFAHRADLGKPTADDYWSQTLYDGQTREELAFVEAQGKTTRAYIKEMPEVTSPTSTLLYIKDRMD